MLFVRMLWYPRKPLHERDMTHLSNIANEIFQETLTQLDAGHGVRQTVQREGESLQIAGEKVSGPVYAVATGKAARPMAMALSEILVEQLTAGVMSGPESEMRPITSDDEFDGRWRVFVGGHPVPNEASLQAAQAAFALLRRAETEHANVVFLISGGGSAMLEWPLNMRLKLTDLQQTNQILVNCGASIGEINTVRRALSAVKGGGLARRAPNAKQFSLIISDTNPGDEASVASGPTMAPPDDAPEVWEVLRRYDLAPRLPPLVVDALSGLKRLPAPSLKHSRHHVLLDQNSALCAVAECAKKRGYDCEIMSDIVEQPIEEGARLLFERLLQRRELHASDNTKSLVGIVSAGEFSCPVRGAGQGGRSSETALRLAILLDRKREWFAAQGWKVVALCAGTDGIDGNSPAAGAVATTKTLNRARAKGLAAEGFLARSDSYNFFAALGNALITGPTGTNVRDVRILLAARNC